MHVRAAWDEDGSPAYNAPPTCRQRSRRMGGLLLFPEASAPGRTEAGGRSRRCDRSKFLEFVGSPLRRVEAADQARVAVIPRRVVNSYSVGVPAWGMPDA